MRVRVCVCVCEQDSSCVCVCVCVRVHVHVCRLGVSRIARMRVCVRVFRAHVNDGVQGLLWTQRDR